MADISLAFDTGERTLELTDGRGHSVEIRYNPYDMMYLNLIVEAAERLDAEQRTLKDIPTDDWKEVYRTSMAVDKRMRDIIDEVFDAPVCDAIFPRQTVYALGDGFPAWSNLLYAVVEKMDAGLNVEKENAQKRIRKYSEKYKR
jgi:hypothetical protein